MPRLIHGLLVVVLVLSACGDDGGESTTSSSGATTSTSVTTTTTSPPESATTTEQVEMEATGTVIAVDGTLAGIDGFALRLEDGSDLQLVPADGLLFDGTAPLSHVQDHLVSGAPVAVTYLLGGDAPYVCIAIGDASSEGHDDDHSHDG